MKKLFFAILLLSFALFGQSEITNSGSYYMDAGFGAVNVEGVIAGTDTLFGNWIILPSNADSVYSFFTIYSSDSVRVKSVLQIKELDAPLTLYTYGTDSVTTLRSYSHTINELPREFRVAIIGVSDNSKTGTPFKSKFRFRLVR